MTRDPRIDPLYGDEIEHPDGKPLYVVDRKPRMVRVSRSKDWWLSSTWVRLSTYRRFAAGRTIRAAVRCLYVD